MEAQAAKTTAAGGHQDVRPGGGGRHGDGEGFDADLDLLMPRRRPWWLRAVAGLAALAVSVLVGLGVGLGYLYPRPEAWGSGSGSSFSNDPETEVATAAELFYNFSARSLEITDVHVQQPGGVEVLDIYFGSQFPIDGDDGSDPGGRSRDDSSSTVNPRSARWILVELQAGSCPITHDLSPTAVDVTVRLADPAFPPLKRTVAVDIGNGWVDEICAQADSDH